MWVRAEATSARPDMINIAESCRRLVMLFVFATSGLIALNGGATAAAEFDIINSQNGTKLGGIAFPSSSGSQPVGVTFEFHAGGQDYTEADITAVSWSLGPSGDVSDLSLHALIGDNPCGLTYAPCKNDTLTLNETRATPGGIECDSAGLLCGVRLGILTPIEFVPRAPAYTCEGFEPPLDGDAVSVKRNRALPFKAELLDENGFALTDQDVVAAPVLQVTYDSGIGASAVDVTDDALYAGLGSSGNTFMFQGSRWRYNLKVRNFTAPGTYTATMVTGDGAEYRLPETCTAQFVVR
jgi:hypothetical protein